ncbi:hypothetical protein WICPIJ_004362 [Wickerhamomyces pijperi]|uniref:Uncharacterized protein n=1 Tax=Wickerhamomyces pijperi TaxID=599730 RepID=A0A9P8Q7U4_WICPI|nr:hypothetical protein WICPIJ_004362 [Wickerhamomyces pijperi]
MYLEVDENLELPLMTFSTAFKKSFSVATFLLSLMANIPASVQTDLNSAPVEFGHNLEINSHLISLSTLIALEWILKMLARPSKSGRENSTFLSILPGLKRAGSKVFGLFVANITLILPLGSNPSNCVINSNMVL